MFPRAWTVCAPFSLIVMISALKLWGQDQIQHNNDWTDADASQAVWQVMGSDAQVRFEQHRANLGNARSGQWSESVTLTAGHGTFAYLTRQLPPARIHADLKLSLQVKADRAGIQFLARVVFPHTLDPQTKQPLSALIRGSSSNRAGTWETLVIDQVPVLVERQARVLRTQHGKELDTRDPYLDLVLINAYTGLGTTAIAWDDLRVSQLIEASSQVIQASATQEVNQQSTTTVQLQGSVLSVGAQPFFPRVIEYNGESLEYLASLGFNAVRLSTVPTPELLQAARQANLWLIAPPPWQTDTTGSATNLELATELDARWDAVMMWSLGQQLDDRYLPSITAQARQLRRLDNRRQRPLVSAVISDLRAHSRQADVVSLDLWPLGGSFELSDYSKTLEQRMLLTRPGTPIWALIPTQPAGALRSQWQALTGRDWTTTGYDWDVIRLQAWLAIGTGVRGLEFASHSRLDATDAATRQRALALQLVNQELLVMEPWAAAGTTAGRVTTNLPLVEGVILELQNSRLLMLHRLANGSQQVPAHGDEAIRVIVPGVPESFDVLELNTAGIQRLKTKRVAGGVAVTLDKFDDTALILFTGDPLVTQALQRRLQLVTQKSAESQRQLAAIIYEQTQQLVSELPILVRDEKLFSTHLNAAKLQLDQTDRALLQGQRPVAYQAAKQSLAQLGILRRAIWDRAAKSVGSPVASPFAVQLATIPIHWRWFDGLKTTMPLENRLPKGEMESLPALQQAGWKHQQTNSPGVQYRVELGHESPAPTGQYLRLQAVPVGSLAARPTNGPLNNGAATAVAPLESPPLWVSSPAVPMRTGEWLMIRGRIRIPQPLQGTQEGVLVMDSLGGLPLAERIRTTKDWEEFVLYRIAPTDGTLQITIALTGYGEVHLDDLTIRSMGRR